LAFNGPANAAQVFLQALCWNPCLYCAGVIAGIALLLLPALRWRCCAGIFTLILLASLPLSPLHHH
jgi:hypothetical protein